jgi:hypothetical protein
MVERIISGGQTGVDRAALDVALRLGLACGGWCPKGRRAEDGPISERYPLKETTSPAYLQRTRCNVLDSDGTLILTHGLPSGGTALTIEIAAKNEKPHLVIDLNSQPDARHVQAWCRTQHIHVLNVAGARESESPGIYDRAGHFLMAVLSSPQIGPEFPPVPDQR